MVFISHALTINYGPGYVIWVVLAVVMTKVPVLEADSTSVIIVLKRSSDEHSLAEHEHCLAVSDTGAT